MKDNELDILNEDAALAKAVRDAFDAGEVPASLRANIRAAAAKEWTAARMMRRQRMHRWLSGLSSMAAAVVVLTYSTTQYFGRPEPGAGEEEFRRLDRIIDLVSLSYPDEDLTAEELESLALGSPAEVTRASVVARVDRMLNAESDSDLYE